MPKIFRFVLRSAKQRERRTRLFEQSPEHNRKCHQNHRHEHSLRLDQGAGDRRPNRHANHRGEEQDEHDFAEQWQVQQISDRTDRFTLGRFRKIRQRLSGNERVCSSATKLLAPRELHRCRSSSSLPSSRLQAVHQSRSAGRHRIGTTTTRTAFHLRREQNLPTVQQLRTATDKATGKTSNRG